MIELSDKLDIYEVSVSAVIDVVRTIRVEARGESHALEVAKKVMKDDKETHDWVFPETKQIVTVKPDFISEIFTDISPKKIEPDARDKNGKALFIGDDIHYKRAGKVRTATISDAHGAKEILSCDDGLFTIHADEVWKA